jgi:hypothetical protein
VAGAKIGGGIAAASFGAVRVSNRVHRGSRAYRGTSHVYAIRAPDGSAYKIGKSSLGTRVADGASKRAEAQVRRLNRQDIANGGLGGYRSQIRKTFSTSAEALDYERTLRNTFRRIYGPGSLPGNQEHLRWHNFFLK